MELIVSNFAWSHNIHRMGDEDIDILKKKASQGKADYCYMYGRYHYCVRPDADSVAQAEKLFRKAERGGIVDAKVALALMWAFGDFGIVDLDKADKLINEAIDKDCEFGVQRRLLDIILGTKASKANPERAIFMLEQLIEAERKPMWLYLMGRAVMASGNMAGAVEWFTEAANAGFIEANAFIALCKNHNDNWELVNYERYLQDLNDGYTKCDGFAAYLLSYELMGNYDNIEGEELRHEYREQLLYALMYSVRLGYGDAAVLLGDMFAHGYCETKVDKNEAWAWYSKGARFGCSEAYERLFDMILNGEHEGDTEFCDHLALEGARLESQYLTARTVDAYKQGRLTLYAPEIERYYIPAVDIDCGDDPLT